MASGKSDASGRSTPSASSSGEVRWREGCARSMSTVAETAAQGRTLRGFLAWGATALIAAVTLAHAVRPGNGWGTAAGGLGRLVIVTVVAGVAGHDDERRCLDTIAFDSLLRRQGVPGPGAGLQPLDADRLARQRTHPVRPDGHPAQRRLDLVQQLRVTIDQACHQTLIGAVRSPVGIVDRARRGAGQCV